MLTSNKASHHDTTSTNHNKNNHVSITSAISYHNEIDTIRQQLSSSNITSSSNNKIDNNYNNNQTKQQQQQQQHLQQQQQNQQQQNQQQQNQHQHYGEEETMTNDHRPLQQQQQQHLLLLSLPSYYDENDDNDDNIINNPLHKSLLNVMQNEENMILREILYTLQGMNGTYIKFHNNENNNPNHNNNDDIKINIPLLNILFPPNYTLSYSKLGSGCKDIILICYEIGCLYRSIQSFINQQLHLSFQTTNDHNNYNNNVIGCVARAFIMALSYKLEDYRIFLMNLEQRISPSTTNNISKDNNNNNNNNIDQNENNTIYTLREIYIAIQGPLRKLKTLAIVADSMSYNPISISPSSSSSSVTESCIVSGPIILGILYQHANYHGDTRHSIILHQLIQSTCIPWFDMLYDWCTEGRLSDPANEFFVNANTNTNNTNSSRTTGNDGNGYIAVRYLWERGYYLDYDKVPKGFLNHDIIHLAYVVGKGVNYIRQCLQDGEWTVQYHDHNNDNCSNKSKDEHNNMLTRMKLGFSYWQNDDNNNNEKSKSSSTSDTNLYYNMNYKLSQTLIQSASIVHSYILHCIKNEYQLIQHLFALKQFLLLGQGDFFTALLDGIYAEYYINNIKKKKNMIMGNNNNNNHIGIYNHNIMNIVDTSLRSTNAISFSNDILERLQVDLVVDTNNNSRSRNKYKNNNTSSTTNDDGENENSSSNNNNNNKNSIWDMFQLKYTLPDPLVAIVHDNAMICYKRMFTFLFTLKKIEFMLNVTWRQSAILQHGLHLQAQYLGISVKTNIQYSNAIQLLRQIAMTRQSMMHFVCNLKSYLMFEVLEGGWKDLILTIEQSKTLDEVIYAHDHYMNGIFRKSLLTPITNTTTNTSSSSSNNRMDDMNQRSKQYIELTKKLDKPLRLADEFCLYQEKLFNIAQLAADIAANKRREADNRTIEGNWGYDNDNNEIILENEGEVVETTFFGLSDVTKLKELNQLAKDFNYRVHELLKSLDMMLNGGPAWAMSDDTTTSNSTPTSSPVDGTLKQRSSSTMSSDEVFLSDEHDVDSLRFLIFQLDNNKYYGVTQS